MVFVLQDMEDRTTDITKSAVYSEMDAVEAGEMQ